MCNVRSSRAFRCFILFANVVTMNLMVSAQAAQYSLGALGFAGTINGVHQPLGISTGGQVVGYDELTGAGFIWSNGALSWYGNVGSPSQATAISPNGLYMATGSWNGALSTYTGDGAFYVSGYTYPGTLSYGVNNYGASVGQTGGQAFYFYKTSTSPATFKLLGSLGGSSSVAYGITDTNTIVGASGNSAGYTRAFYSFRTGPPTDFDPNDTTYDSAAYAINKNGIVVGVSNRGRCSVFVPLYRCRGPYFYPVTFTPSNVTSLGSLGGGAGAALAINSNGDIVGWSQTATGAQHAFLYTNGHMIDLNTLNIVGGSGWTFTDADAINDYGEIVGHAISPTGKDEIIVIMPLGV